LIKKRSNFSKIYAGHDCLKPTCTQTDIGPKLTLVRKEEKSKIFCKHGAM